MQLLQPACFDAHSKNHRVGMDPTRTGGSPGRPIPINVRSEYRIDTSPIVTFLNFGSRYRIVLATGRVVPRRSSLKGYESHLFHERGGFNLL